MSASIYGIERVPYDTHMRAKRDPISPASLQPLCKIVSRQRQRGQALAPMAAFLTSTLDWTTMARGMFHPRRSLCVVSAPGSPRRSITYAHQILGAAIIHPDMRDVMPLLPAPLVKPEGADKNACERHAAKRVVATLHGPSTPQGDCHRRPSEFSAPHRETLQAHDLRYMLGVKDGDHTDLFKRVQAAEHAGRVSSAERHDHVAGLVQRFRLVNDVPLNASNADVWVHVIEDWAMGADKVQHFSWVTDLRVSKLHVYRLMGSGRARWKLAHETLTTLKNQGSHVEHHDDHGQKHLSVVLAMRMRLAFWVDQTHQRC